jgi:hypothetical protein
MIENYISILGYSKEQICDRFLLLVNILFQKRIITNADLLLCESGRDLSI